MIICLGIVLVIEGVFDGEGTVVIIFRVLLPFSHQNACIYGILEEEEGAEADKNPLSRIYDRILILIA